MPDVHAFLSPSSAERWYNCTPSAWLSDQFPDQGSVYASEGTEAHSLCEDMLKKALNLPAEDPRPSMQYFNQEMQDAASDYTQFILDRKAALEKKGRHPKVFIEQPVDLRAYIPESMGTSDCVIVSDREIQVIDFKYGYYRVSASSLQLRLYALGALSTLPHRKSVRRVIMVIYQPRISNVDEFGMSVAALQQWGNTELIRRAGLAFSGQGDFQAGEWCRSCRARHMCRHLATHQLEIAKYEFRDPPLLTDEALADALKRAEELNNWVASVRNYATNALLQGRRLPGFKLVSGRSTRRFSDPEAAARRVEEAGKEPWEKRILSVAAMERLLGKKLFREMLSDLVTRPEGSPELTRADDTRPEWHPAEDDFGQKNQAAENE